VHVIEEWCKRAAVDGDDVVRGDSSSSICRAWRCGYLTSPSSVLRIKHNNSWYSYRWRENRIDAPHNLSHFTFLPSFYQYS